jgi:hypothetical protein
MPARLKFLTASPARRECFAEAPQNFAGRPEEDGRVFRGRERCPIDGRDVLQREALGAVATLDSLTEALLSRTGSFVKDAAVVRMAATAAESDR